MILHYIVSLYNCRNYPITSSMHAYCLYQSSLHGCTTVYYVYGGMRTDIKIKRHSHKYRVQLLLLWTKGRHRGMYRVRDTSRRITNVRLVEKKSSTIHTFFLLLLSIVFLLLLLHLYFYLSFCSLHIHSALHNSD